MAISAQEMQQRVEMRPTLLVGIGGTGQQVLVQLKARFIKNYGEVPPALEFLCFDTDPAIHSVHVDDRPVTLTADTEFVNIGGVDTASIIRHLDQHEHIRNWIAEDGEKIPPGIILKGAKMVRPLGRLTFFWNVERVKGKLEAAVRRLRDIRLKAEERGINVFIICSVCGGTGSGIFIDMAYLIRHILEEVGIGPRYCYINAVLALPSVFPRVDQLRLRANAYATLTELDYFVETGEWHCDYGRPNVPPIDYSATRPFAICYLVGASNEKGWGLNGLEEVAPLTAEAIYVQISSQVGEANMSAFDNVNALTEHAKNLITGKRKSTAYSSFGTSSLVFPASRIINLCARRSGKELIDGLLETVKDPGRVSETLTGFIEAQRLVSGALLEELARDRERDKVVKVLLDPRRLDQYKGDDLMNATSAFLRKAEAWLDDEVIPMVDGNGALLEERLGAALHRETERLIDDPSFGLRFAVRFLEELDVGLADQRAELNKGREEAEAKKNRAQAVLRQTRQALADSFKGWWPIGRGRKIKAARNRHIQMFQNYLSGRFDVRKREAVIALLAKLSTAIQSEKAALQGLIDRLRFIGSQFETQLERLSEAGTAFVLAEEISTPEDIESYYTEGVERLAGQPIGRLLEAEGPLHEWVEMKQVAITQCILSFTRSVFEHIKDISIEQILLDKKEEVEPRKRLLDLIETSIPFCPHRHEGVLGADWKHENIVVIGVREAERSIYKDALETGQNLASTFDPHTITVLQTKHGLPLFSLTQYEDFKQRHDYVIREDTIPLYLFPEVRPGGERAKQLFALGAVYGFIFKSGVFYYCQPISKEEKKPIRLSRGMSKSLRVFRNEDELVRHVDNLVNTRIQRDGIRPATELIEGFIEEPYIYERKGGVAVEGEMVKDTSVGKPGGVNYDLMVDLKKSLRQYVDEVLHG